MKRFLALALGVLALGSLSGCKQLGCDKPAQSEAPAAAPSEAPAPEVAPESSEENKPA
ncbi:MAG TPA: hypothetical protein VJJ81_00290 [Candidatus Babeliales bacterium]|nr:hypothetical protein [Candidatus Babeliales bacterium]